MTTNDNAPAGAWRRVTSRDPCPICGHDSWCSVGHSVVLCMRNESQRPSTNGGWLHSKDGNAVDRESPSTIPAPPPPPPHYWKEFAEQCSQDITDAQVDELASILKVDALALRELGIGHNGRAWTFPMYAADGSVCGIRTRSADGKKRAVTGSKLGVIRRSAPDDGLLLFCEGESDTAAAITLGQDAIGVPGAGQCVAVAAIYARNRDVVIVADNDEAGETGAAKLLAAVTGSARSLRWLRPPRPHKDLRAWLVAGATRVDLEEAIDAALIVSLGPIADAWKPLPSGILSVRPAPRSFLLRWAPSPPPETGACAGDGFASAGIVGMLSAAGGTGKSMLLLLMAVCIVLGRRFLAFDIGAEFVGRRCLLLFAEEKMHEVMQRMWRITEYLGLTEAEKRLLEQRLVILPLHGKRCGLIAPGLNGALPTPTPAMEQLRARLAASNSPWALVGLDPASRLLPGCESDNDSATVAIQVVEELTEVPGEPLVLVSGHSSKLARRSGSVDARGVTGITDGARLHITLKKSGGGVEFAAPKSNYAGELDTPLMLKKEPGGVLRLATADEVQVEGQAELAEVAQQVRDDADRVVEALRGKRAKAKDDIAVLAHMKADRCRKAVNLAMADGRIVRDGPRGDTFYVVAEAKATGVCVSPPTTPWDGGTASVPAPEAGDGLPSGVPGRQWDGGTAKATATDQDDGMPEKPMRRRKAKAGGGA